MYKCVYVSECKVDINQYIWETWIAKIKQGTVSTPFMPSVRNVPPTAMSKKRRTKAIVKRTELFREFKNLSWTMRFIHCDTQMVI